MSILSQSERITAEKLVREQLGLPMMGVNSTGAVSDETMQIEREILGAQTYAFGEIWSRPLLNIQERCYITLAVLIAKDQHCPLEEYVRAAIKIGVKASDLLEMMLHLGSYTGITSSSEGMNVARRVFTELGITQLSEEEITPIYPMTREDRVEAMMRVAGEIGIGKQGLGDNAPPLQYLKSGVWTPKGQDMPSEADLSRINGEYGYGECWGRPALGYRIRSMITMAALQALFANEQLHFHINNAVNIGISTDEIHEILGHAGIYGGIAGWKNALNIARDIFSQRGMLESV